MSTKGGFEIINFYLQSGQKPLRVLLDQAKENIDVIDFRTPRPRQRNQVQIMQIMSTYSKTFIKSMG